MVTRTPPLTIALIGTGETSAKNVEAQLTDFTTPYAEVTAILPVDDEHWTPTLESAHAWFVANDIPYVAVTDGSSPSKSIVPVLEAADSVIKVARVSTKLVGLLESEKGDGHDVALLVAWDDDDAEATLAVNKALAAELPALNLLDGLDPFEFDDDGTPDDGEEVRREPEGKRTPAKGALPDDEPATEDEYAGWGIRKLRAALRDRDGHGLNDRAIGQLEAEEAREILRKLDGGAEEEPAKETRTTRARRAFAEGAAEGTGDEAQALPRSRGGDILDNEDGDPQEGTQAAETTAAGGPQYPVDALLRDDRRWAVEQAIHGGAQGDHVIPLAMKLETYIHGERRSGGRPRADGTPAQPREIGENGKPVRRRRAASTE